MQKIIATAPAWYGKNAPKDRTYSPIGFGEVRELVSAETREHEDEKSYSPRLRNRLVSWRLLVRNRIAFRHDDKRGPISATLTGAVY